MRKNRPRTKKTAAPTGPAEIPLSEDQRKYLVGQALFCAAGIFLLGMPAFFFTGMAFSKNAGPKAVYFGLFGVASFGFAVLIAWLGRKYVKDLRSGVISRKRAKILQLHLRNGVVRQVEVEGIGMLDPVPGKKIAPFDLDPEAGKTCSVSYSPESGILWNLQ